MQRNKRLTSALLLVAFGIVAQGSACEVNQPVSKPCGVIIDSLKSVNATTRDGQRRLADHFQRGLAAGCWTIKD